MNKIQRKRSNGLEIIFLGCFLLGLASCGGKSIVSDTPTHELLPRKPILLPTWTQIKLTPTAVYPFSTDFSSPPSSLGIERLQVGFSSTGLLRGEINIVNHGPAKTAAPNQLDMSDFAFGYVIRIYDQDDQLVFRDADVWGTDLLTGMKINIKWDTSNNLVPLNNGSSNSTVAFKPAPGNYTVRVNLETYDHHSTQILDEREIRIEVH
jgi:hypothetical protein